MDSYWYDYGYDYGDMDLGVGGLFDGLGSLLGGLFGDYYYDDYDYDDYDDYGYWDDDEVISVGSSDDWDDYSLLNTVSGLFGGLSGYDDTLSVDGASGLLGFLEDGLGVLLGGLFGDDYYYDGYDYDDYDYDDYGYWDDDEVISVGSSDGYDDYSLLDSISGILGGLSGSDDTLSVDGSSGLLEFLGGDLGALLGGLLSGDSEYGSGDEDSDAASLDLLDGLNGISGLDSILGLLGGSGTTLSVDGGSIDSSLLSSILGLLGGSGTTLSADGGSIDSSLLSSILGLLGGSGTTISTDSTASNSTGIDLSSILSLLGGSGTTISTDSPASNSTGIDLSSILGLLGGSGTTSSTDSPASNSTGIDLSTILGLLGGSGTTISTDSSATTTANSGSLLTSILGLLGGSGTTLSVDGSTTDSSSLLSSILGLLGGSSSSLTVDGTGSDLSSLLSPILGLLGGSGTPLSVGGSTTDSSSLLSSILGLLGGSGTTLSVDGADIAAAAGLGSLQDLLDMLTNGNAKLKVEITLTTEEGSSSFLYDGLLSNFMTTVTADVGSLVTTTTFTPEMTVRGLALPANDLVTEVEQVIGSVLSGAPVLSWGDEQEAAAQGYWIEIARGNAFDDAVRVFTAGTSFDIDGSDGAFSCRAALRDGAFETDAAGWTSEKTAPRQIVSNGNGLADVFFASPAKGDIWRTDFRAKNDLTGETAAIAGKNRIRDTFSGSSSDANILYLTDSANGDALFLDDMYSEFGSAARLSLIREIRSGAGDDVIDMSSGHYSNSGLAGMTVRGGSGDDVLWGADGGNMLFGDDGDDRISGGSGNDIIAGGSGNDVLNGGGGSDLFTFGENWGDDVVSQIVGGSIALWFAEDESAITSVELDGNVIFRSGTSSVTVKDSVLADLDVHFGDDQSASFTGLAAAGAFLGSTTESVFETQSARMQGVLASL